MCWSTVFAILCRPLVPWLGFLRPRLFGRSGHMGIIPGEMVVRVRLCHPLLPWLVCLRFVCRDYSLTSDPRTDWSFRWPAGASGHEQLATNIDVGFAIRPTFVDHHHKHNQRHHVGKSTEQRKTSYDHDDVDVGNGSQPEVTCSSLHPVPSMLRSAIPIIIDARA